MARAYLPVKVPYIRLLINIDVINQVHVLSYLPS